MLYPLTGYIRGVLYPSSRQCDRWTQGAAAAAGHEERTGMGNSTATYTVVGMTCNSCVNKVTNAVSAVEGVDDIDVDVSNGTLEVSGQISDASIRDAMAQAGYKIAK